MTLETLGIGALIGAAFADRSDDGGGGGGETFSQSSDSQNLGPADVLTVDNSRPGPVTFNQPIVEPATPPPQVVDPTAPKPETFSQSWDDFNVGPADIHTTSPDKPFVPKPATPPTPPAPPPPQAKPVQPPAPPPFKPPPPAVRPSAPSGPSSPAGPNAQASNLVPSLSLTTPTGAIQPWMKWALVAGAAGLSVVVLATASKHAGKKAA